MLATLVLSTSIGVITAVLDECSDRSQCLSGGDMEEAEDLGALHLRAHIATQGDAEKQCGAAVSLVDTIPGIARYIGFTASSWHWGNAAFSIYNSFSHGIETCWKPHRDPARNPDGAWLQWDFGQIGRERYTSGIEGPVAITRIKTSGCSSSAGVSDILHFPSYELQISNDEDNWLSIGTFDGNTDQDTPVEHQLNLAARYLRYKPTDGTYRPGYGGVRADVFGFLDVDCAPGAALPPVDVDTLCANNVALDLSNEVQNAVVGGQLRMKFENVLPNVNLAITSDDTYATNDETRNGVRNGEFVEINLLCGLSTKFSFDLTDAAGDPATIDEFTLSVYDVDHSYWQGEVRKRETVKVCGAQHILPEGHTLNVEHRFFPNCVSATSTMEGSVLGGEPETTCGMNAEQKKNTIDFVFHDESSFAANFNITNCGPGAVTGRSIRFAFTPAICCR